LDAIAFSAEASALCGFTGYLPPLKNIGKYWHFHRKHYLCLPFLIKEIIMAHHKSAKKRIKQDAIKRLRNRYYKKSTRTSIQKLREMTDKIEAAKFLPKVVSMIDRLAKRNLFHKNKAANLKSGLMKRIAQL
jgi:small subunit ribosomal protein S20